MKKMKKLTVTINAKINKLRLPITLYTAVDLVNPNECGIDVKVVAISVLPLDISDETDFIWLNTDTHKIDRINELYEAVQLEDSVWSKIELWALDLYRNDEFKALPDATDYDLSL